MLPLVLLLAAGLVHAERLPPLGDEARPLRYRLAFTVDPAAPRFRGAAEIDVHLAAPAKSVILHALGLRILSARVIAGDGVQEARAARLAGERLEVTAPRGIPAGEATLRFDYSGTLSSKAAVGAYRRKGPGGWYAYTTFTPIEARRAFPCFDEPRFKTPFEITLRVPAKLTAASNARAVEERTEQGGMKRVRFAATQPLPAEVVAFVVGPFDVVDAGVAGRNSIPVRILASKGRGADARLAALETPEILRKIEEYTGIAYPWDKLDHAALLEGSFGAVENPGLITYQQRVLISTPGDVSTAWKRRLRSLMTHELAHQWFGNLVTQARWEDVWLSEGLATWLEMKLMDLDASEADRGLRAAESRQKMMAYDAGADARAVRVPLDRREQAKDVYHFTVYQKAAGVLRMIEQWLGEERFREGIRLYLRRHAHGAAGIQDFAAALGEASGRDAMPVLSAFLDHPGNPRVAVELECRPAARPVVRLTQGAPARPIPVCVRSPAGTACELLLEEKARAALADEMCPAWIIPNAGGVGYFIASAPRALIERAPLTKAERRALSSDQGVSRLKR
jgi:alanyl aminopeptidase